MKDEKEKKEAALKEELTLLGNMMKQHEWAQFGQEEAEKEAELESKLDSEAAGEESGSSQDWASNSN